MKKFIINNLEDTKELASKIASICKKEDVIALTGDLGAGKTAFARFFINSLMEKEQEVLSPTFNLVHPYDTKNFTIWHFDLYRLESAAEVEGLGIFDAFDNGVSLIEWPQIIDDILPKNRLLVNLSENNGTRIAVIEGIGKWKERLENTKDIMNQDRENLIKQFLADNSLAAATRHKLASDASFRRYERITGAEKPLMLMDAPPEKEKVKEFIFVGNFLAENGFSAPHIYASDEENGLLLLEDIGDNSFTNVLAGKSPLSGKYQEKELYLAAMDVLVDLKNKHLPSGLPPYGNDVYMREAKLLTEWYLPNLNGSFAGKEAAEEYDDIWNQLLQFNRIDEDVVVLRDYHADNLMWLPERDNIKNVGLLDFQDALAGSPVYDVISLLEDARRDVAEDTVTACIEHYITKAGIKDREAFMAEYALIAAQRNCKIVGIFARLAIRDGKERYINYLPRVWGHLENDLKHPALKPLKDWMDKVIPANLRKPEALKLAKKEYAVG